MRRSDRTRKPRVAVIGTRGYPSFYGGFETAVRELAPSLADAGWDVTVYGRPGAMSDAGADPRIRTVVTRGSETKSLSTLSFGFTAVLHALVHRPDVALVMNCANGFWLPLLRLRGIPVLVNVDGIEWERAKWGRLARAVFRAGARMTAWSANRLVFDAAAIGSYWQRVFRRDGVVIPYGGVESFDTSLAAVDADAGLRPGGYALMVARFVPENTVGEFLDAAARIAEQHDVVIVGSTGYGGELDERADRLASKHPRVHRLGHLSDDRRLHALWHNTGAYFHGHSVGGTNPALVQAMHCGAPTVARDTVYNREVLGDAGVFVAPEPSAIASAVLDILRDPGRADALAVAGVARALDAYTWSGVCAAYERELRRLLPSARPVVAPVRALGRAA